MLTKSRLAIILSKLKTFEKPKIKLEQYPTDSEIAADMLWNAFMTGEIEDKEIADFGAGTGILGIGALLLQAEHVTFIEKDPDNIPTLKENLKLLEKEGFDNYTILNQDVTEINQKFDIVIQNPPFGSQQKHADKEFLKIAFKSADIIYSIHMAKSETFLDKFTRDEGFQIAKKWKYEFPLKSTYSHHKRRIQRIETLGLRIIKSKPF